MQIKDLAAAVGLTADTIRFYEKQGMLNDRHVGRSANGYRYYTPAAIERLHLIKLGQASGFTLAEIRGSIDQWEQGEINDEQQAEIIAERIQRIDVQIAQLQRLRAYFVEKATQVGQGEAKNPPRLQAAGGR